MSDSATPWPVGYQVPPSMGFYRQEYWSVLSCPSPGDLTNPGMELASPITLALQADSLLLSHGGSLFSIILTFKGIPILEYLNALL